MPIKAMHDNLANIFKDLMERSWSELEQEIQCLEHRYGNDERSFSRECKEWIPDYSTRESRERICYDEINTDRYYFCHFGSAYALEYSLLYQLVLLDMNGAISPDGKLMELKNNHYNDLSVLSLGCGSLIDLWGLCYAVSRLNSEQHRLFNLKSYTGYDRCNWALKFDRNRFSRYFDNRDAITEYVGNDEGDILNCFGEGVSLDQNIIIFPKIINELNANVMQQLKDKISQTDFTSDVLYVCFSHSYTELERGADNATDIINSISDYDLVDYNFLNINADDKSDIVRQIYKKNYLDFLVSLKPNEDNPSVVYTFETEDKGESESDRDKPKSIAVKAFDSVLSVSREINQESQTLPQYFRSLNMKHSCFPSVLNYPAGSGIGDKKVKLVFQIVKLTRA